MGHTESITGDHMKKGPTVEDKEKVNTTNINNIFKRSIISWNRDQEIMEMDIPQEELQIYTSEPQNAIEQKLEYRDKGDKHNDATLGRSGKITQARLNK